MRSTKNERKTPPHERSPDTDWGGLPPELRVLHIHGGSGPRGWLSAAFGGTGPCRVELTEAFDLASGLESLRNAVFDAVLVDEQIVGSDPSRVVASIRAGSRPRQPVLILSEDPDSDQAARCLEGGADAHLPIRWTTARELEWQVARAAERGQLLEENERLRQRDRQQRKLEREEALQLLAEQTELVADCATFAAHDVSCDDKQWLRRELEELLRTYVLMGRGHLTDELTSLAARLEQEATPASVLLRVYLQVLQSLLLDLGSRSSRHVMNRGHLLLLQLLLTTQKKTNDETFDHHPHLQRS